MRPHLPDASAVLAGKVRASVEQIFALIHAANPTDRGLSRRETSERYALKSRLQSFLIHHHADVLEVLPEGGDGVVSIRHRIAGRDAAHAVIATLDDDARRWVETELALGPPAVAAPATTVVTRTRRVSDANDALSRGIAALNDYDFDAARAFFEEALPTRGIDAARALVSLLVDHLALDDEALAMAGRLPAAALNDTTILGPLALAAARTGDGRAERWARTSRSGEAWAEIAAGAVRRADLEAAVSAIDALQDADAAHPALRGLTGSLAVLRRTACRPAEEALTAAFDRGDDGEIDRLLPTLPADAVIVARVRAHRRRMLAQKEAATASEAYASADFAAVILHARRAAELGDDEIRAWAMDAEASAKEALASHALARARATLDAGNLDPYRAPDAASRAEARAARPSLLLELIERIPDRPGRVAAGRALADLIAGHGDIDALAVHAHLLTGLTEYKKLQTDTRARRQRAFLDELVAAEDDYCAGDLDGAARRLAALDRSFSGGSRKQLDDLERAVQADQAKRDAVNRVEHLASRGDIIGARDLARAVGQSARAAKLAETVHATWEVEVMEGDGVPLRDVVVPEAGLLPLLHLSGDGATLYLVKSAVDRLFVRVVETETAIVRKAVTMRTPLPMAALGHELHDKVLTVFAANGALLQLATSNWEIRRWFPPPARLNEQKVVAMTLVGDRYVWCTIDDEATGNPATTVLDLEAWPTARQSRLPGHAVPLIGALTPTVVRLLPAGGIVSHTPSGTAHAKELKLRHFPPTHLTVAPLGDGLLAFGDAASAAEMAFQGVPISMRGGPDDIAALCVRDNGMLRVFGMSDVLRTDGLDVATSTEAETFILRRRRSSDTKVYGGRTEAWEIIAGVDAIVPSSTVFVRDAASRFVRALCWAPDGIAVFDPLELVPAWSIEVEDSAVLDLRGLAAPFPCTFSGDGPFMILADTHAATGDWQSVSDTLGRINIAALAPAAAQHCHHLLSLGALRRGDLPAAQRAIRAARSLDGGCALNALTSLNDALAGNPAGPMGAYVGLIRAADAHLARGEAEAARDLLDSAHVWRGGEWQGLVRLAAAWLQIAPQTSAERFRKRLALATVCGADRSGLPILSAACSDAWVAEILEGARGELA